MNDAFFRDETAPYEWSPAGVSGIRGTFLGGFTTRILQFRVLYQGSLFSETFGGCIIRILQFRVLYQGPLFSETPLQAKKLSQKLAKLLEKSTLEKGA